MPAKRTSTHIESNRSERPQTLREVAARARSFADFGREFQDWLHTLRALRSRPAIAEAIKDAPEFLDIHFPDGATADAWLAAYAEHLAVACSLPVPAWTAGVARIACEPWFESETPALRLMALRDSPAAFKHRNLYTTAVDLPVRLGAGRPAVSSERLRANNAIRQRRFRARRRAELEALREIQKGEITIGKERAEWLNSIPQEPMEPIIVR